MSDLTVTSHHLQKDGNVVNVSYLGSVLRLRHCGDHSEDLGPHHSANFTGNLFSTKGEQDCVAQDALPGPAPLAFRHEGALLRFEKSTAHEAPKNTPAGRSSGKQPSQPGSTWETCLTSGCWAAACTLQLSLWRARDSQAHCSASDIRTQLLGAI